ncbi:DUF397 domain-containing protein [Kitasatospora sp. MAP5-34]|uniref:DUF397 domain-containing protein n=1 Tax=Kitasatospora sp. MAP5-34 TaxID=3035102 RepID=UPI0024740AC7|nr:DUF397 domain-containing protein [Kitasatospora sp. MAP5-34]MDH6579780.1 hypothetical protein [Kitasatospora sp. MAP5-34]
MNDPVDLTGASWFKSSYSNNGGDCVEVAPGFPGMIPVRDSKNPEGPALIFGAEAWTAFTRSVAAGEFGSV